MTMPWRCETVRVKYNLSHQRAFGTVFSATTTLHQVCSVDRPPTVMSETDFNKGALSQAFVCMVYDVLTNNLK